MRLKKNSWKTNRPCFRHTIYSAGVAYGIGVRRGRRGDLITTFGAHEAFLGVALACLLLGFGTIVLSDKLRLTQEEGYT